jgi:hypothetical protein
MNYELLEQLLPVICVINFCCYLGGRIRSSEAYNYASRCEAESQKLRQDFKELKEAHFQTINDITALQYHRHAVWKEIEELKKKIEKDF